MRILPVSLLALFLALPVHSKGLSLAGVTLPDAVDAKGHNLVLNGMALRKKFVVKVYVGGLYLAAKESSAAKIVGADGPRRMVMHFLYGVSKDQMCEAWDEGLKQNTPSASGEVKKGFATLCSWMEPIDKGNQIVLTYIPGEGTTVEVNGKVKGTIPGKATADAVVNTWIGPDPGPGADFKQGVLGQ